MVCFVLMIDIDLLLFEKIKNDSAKHQKMILKIGMILQK